MNQQPEEDSIYLASEDNRRKKMPPPYVSIFFIILAIILGFYAVMIQDPEEGKRRYEQNVERSQRAIAQEQEYYKNLKPKQADPLRDR